MSQNYASKVLAIAAAELGYLEKASNSQLDSKTANAGSANYTKYGRDMHALYPAVMDFPGPWCDCFVDWCFYQAFGISTAKSLLAGDFNDYTVASAQMYKNKGAWFTSNPQVGDQIFFKNAAGTICHTGLIYKVANGYLYTYEGNTSSASGVVENGGCVRAKSYYINYSRIAGYGRPKYDAETSVVAGTSSVSGSATQAADFKTLIKNLQTAINAEYGKSLVVDGVPGEKTLAATPTLNSKIRSTKPKTVTAVQKLLTYFGYSCTVDGDFYTGTANSVKSFQKEKVGMPAPDGELTAGQLSWKKLLMLS